MFEKMRIFPSLQLFAQGEGDTGVTAPDAGVQGVKQEADPARLPEDRPEDPEAQFERLIRGQFKDQYNARVQDTVRKRLKSQNETLEQYRTMEPSLKLLAQKYGLKAEDTQGLARAIEADLEHPELRHQRATTHAKGQYQQWLWQAQQARELYPSLELSREVHNPKFMELLRSGASVGDAYLVAHRDEIIPAAMRYTARTVEEKLRSSIAASGARPSETAMLGRGGAAVSDQVSHMSKAQRQDIIRRARQGEIIRF